MTAPRIDLEWDAGDLGCGELVLELRRRLEGMDGGQIIKVSASDPGARADMPAWCRMTGHLLILMDHPMYFIQKGLPKET